VGAINPVLTPEDLEKTWENNYIASIKTQGNVHVLIRIKEDQTLLTELFNILNEESIKMQPNE
jgi:hypothetical protein